MFLNKLNNWIKTILSFHIYTYIYIYLGTIKPMRSSHLKQYFTLYGISNPITGELPRRHSEIIPVELNTRRNTWQMIIMKKVWSDILFPQSLQMNLLLCYVLTLWRYPTEQIVIIREKFCAQKQNALSFTYVYTREKDYNSKHLLLQL